MVVKMKVVCMLIQLMPAVMTQSPALSSTVASPSSTVVTATPCTVQSSPPLLCRPVRSDISECNQLKGRGNSYAFPMALIGIDNVFLGNKLFRGIQAIGNQFNIPPECIDILLHVLCLAAAPPCSQDTCLPVLICNGSCAIFKQIIAGVNLCASKINRLKALRNKTLVPVVSMLIDHFFKFDCEDPSTYFFRNFTRYDSNICTDLYSPETLSSLNMSLRTESGTSSLSAGDNQTLLLAILLPSLFIILSLSSLFAIICLSCYFSHRKRRKDSKELQLEEVNGFTEISSISHRSIIGLRANERYKKAFKDALILYGSLAIEDQLGQGAFGKVFKGRHRTENGTQTVAIKTLKSLTSYDELNKFLLECAIMKDFHHPHVLGLVGVVFDTPDGVPYLVLPFMELGDLKHFLKTKRKELSDIREPSQDMDLSKIVKMCIDIAQGMEYLAEKKFVHRDLAARNCMVSKDLLIKVGDFGLARDIYCTDYYRSSNKDAKLPIKWMPPEAFNDKISNEKTDVWSYGVTCWEVFSLGKTPYPTVPNCEIFHYISTGGRLRKPDLCPDEMFEFMENCWEMKSEDRPNFSQLVKKLAGYWDDEYRYI